MANDKPSAMVKNFRRTGFNWLKLNNKPMLVSSRASLSSQSSHPKPDSSTPRGCWWAAKSSLLIQWISYLNHVDQFVWGQCGRAILILKFWFVIFFLICLFWFLCKKPIFIFRAEHGIAATTAALWLIVVPMNRPVFFLLISLLLFF